MLTRRTFFQAAAGAAAVAAGGAGAAAAPAVSVGVDLAAGADRTVLIMSGPHNAERFARMQAIWQDTRNRLMWGVEGFDEYGLLNPPFEPNDVTREQLAANLPVIGKDALPADKPMPKGKALVRECNRPVPEKESEAQFLRRMSLPCPGRRE